MSRGEAINSTAIFDINNLKVIHSVSDSLIRVIPLPTSVQIFIVPAEEELLWQARQGKEKKNKKINKNTFKVERNRRHKNGKHNAHIKIATKKHYCWQLKVCEVKK